METYGQGKQYNIQGEVVSMNEAEVKEESKQWLPQNDDASSNNYLEIKETSANKDSQTIPAFAPSIVIPSDEISDKNTPLVGPYEKSIAVNKGAFVQK